ncbi:BON domain-containing protein [Fulvivirgaceae bacterium PWU5]|uniref:BON domain-containing protein n=1 Tax=Dawidia cretensis TaxID=2782350 RepID=A0AAP2DVW3_9BACT|nr:BON domain-containing protein [Dawidia cretensis]MBT1707208.1 BON domain-containing protein [Dawidia cretensis]
MRTYNQQIEDAYASSRREGDGMRNREIERSSGQDRRNRYRDDKYSYSHEPYPENEISHMSERGNIRGNAEQHTGIHRGKGPRNYRRSDDRIVEDVSECLADDPYVDASGIAVEVKLGEVVLSGTVPDRMMKRRAEDIVEAVPGVLQVENRIRIETTFEQQGAPETVGENSNKGEREIEIRRNVTA